MVIFYARSQYHHLQGRDVSFLPGSARELHVQWSDDFYFFIFFNTSFNVFAYLGKVSPDELPLQTPEVIRGDNEIDLQTYHNVQHILISFKLYFGRRLFFISLDASAYTEPVGDSEASVRPTQSPSFHR